MRVFIGYDSREQSAADVCARTLRRVTNGRIEPEFLMIDKLEAQGLMWRVRDERGGQDYDITGNATASTRFKFSRFLVPILCQSGPALFLDCDMLFLEDPRRMLDEVDLLSAAVHVVKHDHRPIEQYKMVSQVQTTYPRKNWSSVILWNCAHYANRRLKPEFVAKQPTSYLHRFEWITDDRLGEIPVTWNYLETEYNYCDNAKLVHHTLGIPAIPHYAGSDYADEWNACLLRAMNVAGVKASDIALRAESA